MRSVTLGFGPSLRSFHSAAPRLRAPSRRVLATALIFTFASALSAPVVQAQAQFFSLFVSVGQASIQIDHAVGPNPPDKDLTSDQLDSLRYVGQEFPLIALAAVLFAGNFDPYFAARVRITNLTTSSQPIGLQILMPMQAVPAPPTPPFAAFTGLASISLMDTDGDLSSSYTGGGRGFALSDFLGAQLTTSHSVDLSAPGTVVVYDIPSLPVPESFPFGQWTRMEFVHFAVSPTVSSLSATDSVEFYIFGCVALPATSCPAPLPLPLPEPQALAALWAAVAGLAAVVRRRRNGRREENVLSIN